MMETVVDSIARRIGASIARPPVPAEIQHEADAMWRDRLATILVFRVALPRLGARPAAIAEDLTTAGLVLGWGFLWLRWSGVNPESLFTTSAVVTSSHSLVPSDAPARPGRSSKATVVTGSPSGPGAAPGPRCP